VSSSAAPVLLMGGWTLAAARQPGGFDQVRDTISALAAHGAQDRWIMTTALAGLGICHVVTAAALRPARPAGRAVLAAGGVATVLVAVIPLPADGSGSLTHTVAAATAFLALAVWPAGAGNRAAAPVLRPSVSGAAAAGLLGLVGWFGAELVLDGGRVGLSERAAAGAQSLWPFVVAVGLRAARARVRRPGR
jgi:hypothetical membrane protein